MPQIQAGLVAGAPPCGGHGGGGNSIQAGVDIAYCTYIAYYILCRGPPNFFFVFDGFRLLPVTSRPRFLFSTGGTGITASGCCGLSLSCCSLRAPMRVDGTHSNFLCWLFTAGELLLRGSASSSFASRMSNSAMEGLNAPSTDVFCGHDRAHSAALVSMSFILSTKSLWMQSCERSGFLSPLLAPQQWQPGWCGGQGLDRLFALLHSSSFK
jgi:hypothetical protein